MKYLILFFIIVLLVSVGIYGRSGAIITPSDLNSITAIDDINDVKLDTVHRYKVEMPDGTEKIVESETKLTEKQYNDKYIVPIENRMKEIDAIVKAMTTGNTYDIEKPWSMYGKVIQYNYRVTLPDGSRQWINSDIPMTQGQCLSVAQDMYRDRLTRELNENY